LRAVPPTGSLSDIQIKPGNLSGLVITGGDGKLSKPKIPLIIETNYPGDMAIKAKGGKILIHRLSETRI